ncbi:MBL fold metallo-hydrolase [Geothermobacter hydrogeniphilus]|uniref:MBL fold metallo-hydrolase n=1 Tax=Geothermobacter hydrogeniphilus TaxID=1969733 RepID=A0A2K2H7V7_9BACT|nr:MBL fold metallo-hydrolase [Geothermobacter hydrogeniphilus]PNU19347.1 MBL fold metallo-hydrolase [Geothermobacter hydrogeniphilus]
MRLLLIIVCLLLPCLAWGESSYQMVKLTDGVYAAIARTGSRATSNALLVVGRDKAVVIGAHFTREAIQDLVTAGAAVTGTPIRYFVLAHHHRGYSHIDFDFPPGKEVIMSWQTWLAVNSEKRAVDFPVIFFREGMTLKLGSKSLILTNVGPGHTDGDVVAYLPEDNVLFTSDLLYTDSVGYMGDGHMREWVLALDFLENLQARYVVPGQGPVSRSSDIRDYKNFFKDFLTAIINHIERGDSLKKTLRTFDLPQHRDRKGYKQFMQTNIRRAYLQLREQVSPKN